METDNNTVNIDSSEENQDLSHTDRLLKGLELNINLVENSSKVIETIEEQSPILERELMTTATHIKNLTSRLSMHESVTKVAENVMNSIRAEYNISISNEAKNSLDEDILITTAQYEDYLEEENDNQFTNLTDSNTAEDDNWLEFKGNKNEFTKNHSFDDEENYIYEKEIKQCKTPNSSLDEANEDTSYEQSEMKRLSLNSIRQKLEHDDSIKICYENNDSSEQALSCEEAETKLNEFDSSSFELNQSSSTTILHDSNTCENMVQEPAGKFETFVEEVRIDSKLLNISNDLPASESTEPLIEEKIEDHDFEIIPNKENEAHFDVQVKDYLDVARISISESSEPLITEDFDQKFEYDFKVQNDITISRSSSDNEGLENNSFIKIERKNESFIEPPLIDSADSSKIENLDDVTENIIENSEIQKPDDLDTYFLTDLEQDLPDHESSSEIMQLNYSDSMKYIHEKKLSNNSENKSKSLTNLDTLVVSSTINETNDNHMSSNSYENSSNDTSLDEINIPKINIQLNNNISNQVDINLSNNFQSEDAFIVDEHDVLINTSDSAELLVSNTGSFDKPDYYIHKHDENSSEEETPGNNNFENSITSSTCSSTASSVRQGTPRVAAKYISITHNVEVDANDKNENLKENDTICNIRIQGEKKDALHSSIKQINVECDDDKANDSRMKNFWNKKITSDDSQELLLLNRDDEKINTTSSFDRNERDLLVGDKQISKEKILDSEEENNNSWVEVDDVTSSSNCNNIVNEKKQEMIRSRECDNFNLLETGEMNVNEQSPEDFILVEKDEDSEDMDSKIAKFVVENTLKKFEEDTAMLLDDEYDSDHELYSSQRSEITDNFESVCQTTSFDDKRSYFKRVQSEPVILSEYKPYKINDTIDDETVESKMVIKETIVVPEIEFKLPQQLLEKLNRNTVMNSTSKSNKLLDEELKKFEGEEANETSPSAIYQEAGELIEEVIQSALNIIEMTENLIVETDVNLKKRDDNDDDDDHSDEGNNQDNGNEENRDRNLDDKNQTSNDDKQFESAPNEHDDQVLESESYEAVDGSTYILVTELLEEKEQIFTLQSDIKNEIMNIEINHQAILEKVDKDEFEPLLIENENQEESTNDKILISSPNDTWLEEHKVNRQCFTKGQSFDDEENFLYEKSTTEPKESVINIEQNEENFLKNVFGKMIKRKQKKKHDLKKVLNEQQNTKLNSELSGNTEITSVENQPNEFQKSWIEESIFKNDINSWNQLVSDPNETKKDYPAELEESLDKEDLKELSDQDLGFILENETEEQNNEDNYVKSWNQPVDDSNETPKIKIENSNETNSDNGYPNESEENIFTNDINSWNQLVGDPGDKCEYEINETKKDYPAELEESLDKEDLKELSDRDLDFILENETEEQNNEEKDFQSWNQLVDDSNDKSKTETENEILNYDQNEIMKELIDEEQKLIQLFDNFSERTVFDLTKTPTNEENVLESTSNEENLTTFCNYSQNKIQEAKVLAGELDDVQSRIDSTIQASYDAEDSINKRYDEIIDYVKQEQMNMDQLFDYQLDLLKSQIQFNTMTSSDPSYQIEDSFKKSMSSSQSFETANEEIKNSNSNSNSSSYYTANEKNSSSSPSHYFSACMSSSDEMNFINNSLNKFSSNDSFHSAYGLTSQDSFDNKVKTLSETSSLLDTTLNTENEEKTLQISNKELKFLTTNQYLAPTDADISPYKDEYMENDMNSAGSSVIADTDDDDEEKEIKNTKPILYTFPKLVSEIVEFVQNSDLNLNEQEKVIESQSVIEEEEEEGDDDGDDKFDEPNYKKQVYEGQSFLESVPEVPELDSACNSLKLDSTNDFEETVLHRDFDNILRLNKAETSPDKKRSSTTSSVLEFERLEAQCNTESDKDNTSKLTDFDTTTEESILESVVEEEAKAVNFQSVIPPSDFSNELESKTAINTTTTTPVNEKSNAEYSPNEPSSINSPSADNDPKTIELTSENLKFHNSSNHKICVDVPSTSIGGETFVLHCLNRDRKNSSSRSSNSSLSSSSKSDSLENELNEKITVDSRSFFAKKPKGIVKISDISAVSLVAVENVVAVESVPNYENNFKVMVNSLCVDSGQSSMVGSYIETQTNYADKQHHQHQQQHEGEMITSIVNSSICSSLTTSSTSENNFSQPIEIDVTNNILFPDTVQKNDETSSTKSISPTSGTKKRFSSSSSNESQSKSSFSSTQTIIHVAAAPQKSIFSGEDLPSFSKSSLSKSSGDIISNNTSSIDTCVSNNSADLSSSSLNQISFGILSSTHTHHSNDCYCGSVTRQPTNRGKLKMLM